MEVKPEVQAMTGPYILKVSATLAQVCGWDHGQVVGNVQIDVVEDKGWK